MSDIKKILISKNSTCKSIWFMRQAGRYLPEFKNIRSKNKNFINLCLNSDLSSELTLQPIKRFNIDNAIIFSDILMVPYALGQKVKFVKNFGPVLSEFKIDTFNKTNYLKFITNLNPVYKAIKKTKKKLDSKKSLIGFVGAPWTLLIYIMNLKSKKNLININKIKNNKVEYQLVIEKLTLYVCKHIEHQVSAGADVIQIFDSWAGLLKEEDLEKFCYNPNKEIVDFCKNKKIPVICFPKGIKKNYLTFQNYVKPDGINIDYDLDPLWARENLTEVALQGGMNPRTLLLSDQEMYNEARRYLDIFQDVPYIFNLGHGIVPETDPKKVEKLIKFVREYK